MNASDQTDHDLLITVHEQVRGVRDDIKEIKNGFKASIDDHEIRLRSLEKKQWVSAGGAGVVSAGVALLAQWFINHK